MSAMPKKWEDRLPLCPSGNQMLGAMEAEIAELRAALASQGVAMPAECYAVIEEAAQVLESAAAHNRSKFRTVLAHTQQDRADRLRAVLAAPQPPAVKEAEPDYSACCDTPHLCGAVRRCTAKDATR